MVMSPGAGGTWTPASLARSISAQVPRLLYPDGHTALAPVPGLERAADH
jgi:hypothetical protein